jgi:hypothetical protein
LTTSAPASATSATASAAATTTAAAILARTGTFTSVLHCRLGLVGVVPNICIRTASRRARRRSIRRLRVRLTLLLRRLLLIRWLLCDSDWSSRVLGNLWLALLVAFGMRTSATAASSSAAAASLLVWPWLNLHLLLFL